LRGLIGPDWPHGLITILKEDAILRVLDAEATAASMADRLDTRRAMVSAIDPRHLKNFVHDLSESTSKLVYLRNLDFDTLFRKASGMDAAKLKLVFQSMQKSGIIPTVAATPENLSISPEEQADWFKGYKRIEPST